MVDMDLENSNDNSNQLAVVEDAGHEVVQPRSARKRRSSVWEHFTIQNFVDDDGCRRAFCNECKKKFAYSRGPKVAGTSHLNRHILNGRCKSTLRSEEEKDPKTNTRPRKRLFQASELTLNNTTYEADYLSRHALARMMIMHDYELHMVEHNGFNTFLQNLQPRYDKISFSTLEGDCIATYLRGKLGIMSFIEGIPGRISLATDIWTSSQSTGYVFVIGHYIDCDWKLRRRLLNVVMEPHPESDTAFSHAVAVCLSDWCLEKRLFSLTVNQPLSGAAAENLSAHLSIKKNHILNGCLARTLSSMAVDLIQAGSEVLKMVRDNVRYVKLSAAREETFSDLRRQLQIPSSRILILDDQAKWNTTYELLVAALEVKEVFSCLDTFDPEYKLALSMEQWKQVETLRVFMKLFHDTAVVLSTTTSIPTADKYFHEICKIQRDLARARASNDSFIASFLSQTQEKFDKFWRESYLILATASALDPRFKMKLVEFSFIKIYGEDAAGMYIKQVDDEIHALFQEYLALNSSIEEGNTDANRDGEPATSNGLADFDAYIMNGSSQQSKSELDIYLEDSPLSLFLDLDVCNWWNLNKTKYPTLSKMVRDILSLPVSTVSSDSVFDTAPKEMDPYRSSLRPETVEALICAKEWFLQGPSVVESLRSPEQNTPVTHCEVLERI